MAMTGLTTLGSSDTGAAGVESISNILVVILDLNISWWSDQMESGAIRNGVSSSHASQQYSLAFSLDQIFIFLNSYLLIQPNNKVVVLGCLESQSYFLYPPTGDASGPAINDSRPEAFRMVNEAVLNSVRNILTRELSKETQNSESSHETVFIGALSRSLCYIHRLQREAPKGQLVNGRVLVIETGLDSSSHYMHFINTIFTAQKMNIKMDACVLGEDSVLLQQAVDLTGGLYVKVDNAAGIAQVLNTVFLLDADERSKFVVPERVQVDYRAACFCHQKLVEVGFVCSVCLSVFCVPGPMCTTCNSVFKYMLPQKQKRKGPLTNGKTAEVSPSSQPAKRKTGETQRERNGNS
ncbi:hypothetical protein RvY_13493 [Ramazzottius varieornatus]|uniref:General transcription factor IIH subunit 3 n=1 Tax=Ramazzottius varieornatus TaxID=947166 RepID=A0A1D1VN11_RAMVA|nr:hypothetical protein RvY_13493 [Ramazzottius varieornatus]